MQLNSKNVLITGGSSGLGLEIAKLLLLKNSNVHIIGKNETKLSTLKNDITQPTFFIHHADVADYQQLERVVQEIGQIDVLINCAGIWLEGPLEQYSITQIDQVIDVNVKGVIYTCRLILPQMLTRNQGFIVNISSTYGVLTRKLGTVYGASKFAVRGFTDQLREDLKGTNIKTACLFPGGMKTNLFSHAGVEKNIDNYMDPKKMAEVVIFMLERDDNMLMSNVLVEIL